ncbi:MAG: hypothetical protein H7Z14_08370 [Anaerolineae bacterium]|nr:hypothetical protein [Phycisphaerae bacterium]
MLLDYLLEQATQEDPAKRVAITIVREELDTWLQPCNPALPPRADVPLHRVRSLLLDPNFAPNAIENAENELKLLADRAIMPVINRLTDQAKGAGLELIPSGGDFWTQCGLDKSAIGPLKAKATFGVRWKAKNCHVAAGVSARVTITNELHMVSAFGFNGEVAGTLSQEAPAVRFGSIRAEQEAKVAAAWLEHNFPAAMDRLADILQSRLIS